MVKLYKASQELIDLLLKYGFSDKTEKLYPHHYQRMKAKGYDPYSMKRIFCFSQHSDYLLFHYLYIRVHHSSLFNATVEKNYLTTEEVRSLIAFYRLPTQIAREWLDAYYNAFELHRYYEKICALPEFYDTDLDKCIKQAYEEVIIR